MDGPVPFDDEGEAKGVEIGMPDDALVAANDQLAATAEREGAEDAVDSAEILNLIEDCKNVREGLQLDLPKKGLLWIPNQVKSLRRLRVLNLRANQISMIPTELCETLTDLEFLSISWNRLQYLPENLSSMARLRTILLQNNQLSELPEAIGKLPLLQELRVDNNVLEALPPTIGKLALLELFTMHNNKVTDLPPSMMGLRSLKTLDITDNPLEYENIPDSLHRLNEMHELLHSKTKRRAIITRANAIRRTIRTAVRDELFAGIGQEGAGGGGAEDGGSGVY